MILVEMSILDVTLDDVSRLDVWSRREMISIYMISSSFYKFCEDSVNFCAGGLTFLRSCDTMLAKPTRLRHIYKTLRAL